MLVTSRMRYGTSIRHVSWTELLEGIGFVGHRKPELSHGRYVLPHLTQTAVLEKRLYRLHFEECRRHSETKCLGRFEIDRQLKNRRGAGSSTYSRNAALPQSIFGGYFALWGDDFAHLADIPGFTVADCGRSVLVRSAPLRSRGHRLLFPPRPNRASEPRLAECQWDRSHSATEGVANGTYTSFENFQTSRDRDFYVCGRSGDVRRGAHIRPPACRGNARLCAADRQGMRLVPREQIGRRCPHRSRQGFPEEPQIVLRRA